MFAKKYLYKNNNEALIPGEPEINTAIIVVIPCFREPDIVQTLESVKACYPPKSNVEVIVLINHSEIANHDVKSFNHKTKAELDTWITNNSTDRICFYAVGPLSLKKKWAGAGLARKKGMDEAVRRFDLLENPDGIIVSLDADTLVDKNYLLEIENYFNKNKKHVGATITFEHQKHGLDKRQLEGILLYEKYLDYYKRALHFSGYPYSMFTIGSAFAVTALAYVKRGGMNRRQAGEDFYFLQNLVQIGTVGEITSTKVYPSSRLSDRVPFGTGPILQKWMKGEEDLTLTYNFKTFRHLKLLFDNKELYYKITETRFRSNLEKLPDSVSDFMLHDGFWNELNDLNQNCSNLITFQNRFFQKFNAFKILKYLNFAHEKYFSKTCLPDQIKQLEQEILSQSNVE
ncbi:glycosyltransferase [Prolixibacteraceae bacterium Z1-6]|uniref:Glycosyltransferase n=1 Tax=Draconibacterium aestuarii TaxID=2998507 RepID=A0A9X3J6T6_9BACT|nr:glycosyltransferase [Prolixibacteraceae bacterium Z1-6]